MYVNHFFVLDDGIKDELRKMTPVFGYGEFGEFIFYSFYSRMKEDGSQESWSDVVIRVVEGVFSIRKNHYVINHILWDENYWQTYAREFAVSMFRMEFLCPGRGLWAMGTRLVYERGAMALYNCAATTISPDSWITDLCWVMDVLMHGCGAGIEPIRNDRLKLCEPEYSYHWTIPDSREGWTESVKRLLEGFYIQQAGLPVFDYSEIRPKGALIKTFGGIASGPAPLIELHERITQHCYDYLSGYIDPLVFLADITNMIGCCIVTGNIRRSAEILIGKIDDPVFMDLKNSDIFPEREAFKWMSNNTVKLEHTSDFDKLDEIAYRVRTSGDPGVMNMMNIKKGRIGKQDGLPEDKATLLNPCLTGDSKVLTPDGIRTIADIDVGSTIWSEGGWTKVVRKVSSGIQDTYRYGTRAGAFYGTKEHQIISEGLKCPIEHADVVDTLIGLYKEDERPDDLQAIVDGLVVGDGTMRNGNVTLCVGKNDQDYFASEIRNYIGNAETTDYFYSVQTTITELTTLPTRNIPKKYLTTNSRSVKSFLRGLYSANGHVGNRSVILTMSSLVLIENVQMLLSSIGIRSLYYINPEKTKNWPHDKIATSKQTYDLCITHDRDKFVESVGFIQKYKMKTLLQQIIYRMQRKGKENQEVISITSLGKQEVWDITVDNFTHTFWCNGLNVSNCGEIPLENKELCNLAETIPTRCADTKVWIKSCEFATFYCSTVALLPTHSPESNAVIMRNRRIGISIMDFSGWKHLIGTAAVTKAMRQGYECIRQENKRLSNEAGVKESIRVTTMKPSGTVAKMAGRTPGIGHPNFQYMLRRVQLQDNHPAVELLIDANVPYTVNADSHALSFEFPLYMGDVRESTEISIWEQSLNLVLVQREWADNCISTTLNFTTAESDQIEAVLSAIIPLIKTASLLPHTPEGIYASMPETRISRDEYFERLSRIGKIDWSQFRGSDGQDEKYCTSGQCEIAR